MCPRVRPKGKGQPQPHCAILPPLVCIISTQHTKKHNSAWRRCCRPTSVLAFLASIKLAGATKQFRGILRLHAKQRTRERERKKRKETPFSIHTFFAIFCVSPFLNDLSLSLSLSLQLRFHQGKVETGACNPLLLHILSFYLSLSLHAFPPPPSLYVWRGFYFNKLPHLARCLASLDAAQTDHHHQHFSTQSLRAHQCLLSFHFA